MRRNLRRMGLALLCAGTLSTSGALSACGKYEPVETAAGIGAGENNGAGEADAAGSVGAGEAGEAGNVGAGEADAAGNAGAGEASVAGNAGAGAAARPDNADSLPATAESSRNEVELATAKPPEFEEVDETVYVRTSDGTPVNVRSSCNKQNNSNVVTAASPGTSFKRTGKSGEWSRVILNGQTAYIATDYLTTEVPETTAAVERAETAAGSVSLNASWKYAEFSKINSGAATLYRTESLNPKGKTVCVNAGHGTKGGGSVKTQCHPDGTPKVTGGTTGAGATSAVAVSSGMTFSDGTPEAKVTLALALKLKDKLLADGYDVLMIRESDDVQLDNVARTVIANNTSDCHIALHWDSTTSNKGAFYMSVPSNQSYRNMEPVKSHWQQHNALGESLVGGLKSAGVKIFSGGSMEMDLTQTSYSTIPSVDIELGDKASDHSSGTLDTLAKGLVAGINQYFGY